MNDSDARLVDLSGVPSLSSVRQQRELYAKLAPLVGVAQPAPDPDDLACELLRVATSRYGRRSGPPTGDAMGPRALFAPMEAADSATDEMIWRGWYGTREEPRWCPCQSRFGGRAGRHLGVDLAAPPGVVVLSPATGRAEFNPLGQDPRRGDHVFIHCDGDQPVGVLLCHLQKRIGDYPRRVRLGEPVATAGFSGLTLYGGEPNIFGKHDTHTHLEVVTRAGHVDPLGFLDLKLKREEDRRCFFPADPQRLTVRVPHPLLEPRRPKSGTFGPASSRAEEY